MSRSISSLWEASKRHSMARLHRLWWMQQQSAEEQHLPAFATTFQTIFTPYYYISTAELSRRMVMENGVPQYLVGQTPSGRNPLAAAYLALVCMNGWFRNAERQDLLDSAVHFAEHLIKSAIRHDRMMRLEYGFGVGKFHISRPGWISGITQGLATSLCLRLFVAINNAKYLECARELIAAMCISVENGGTLSETPEKAPWFEEYPSATLSHVLNGHMFSCIALLEYETIANEPLEQPNTHVLIQSLARSFKHYVKGRYLLYDRLHYKYCNPHYMGLCALLCLHIYRITRSAPFGELAIRLNRNTDWTLYLKSVGSTGEQRQDIFSHIF